MTDEIPVTTQPPDAPPAPPKPNLSQRLAAVKPWLCAAWQGVFPGRRAWRGAAYGLALGYLLLVILFAASQMGGGMWAWITLFALTLFGAVMAFLSGALFDLIFGLLGGLPARYRNTLVGTGFLLAMMLFNGAAPLGQALLIFLVVAPASLLGAGLYTLFRSHGWGDLTPLRRGVAVGGTVLGALLVIGLIGVYVWPGKPLPPVEIAALRNAEDIPTLKAQNIPDPSQPGSYNVLRLTYGSGSDLRRPEFGADAALKTQPVDGSAFVGDWEGVNAFGLPGMLRSAYWGFDLKSLPLNGRVWYPEGAGPFPLVMVVHGNHGMMDDSDPGYAYLCELLASRGMICVSVDENFLNGSWFDFMPYGDVGAGNLNEENDGRGWLLLRHIAQFRAWSRAQDGNPFADKVDMKRVALIGHSRGGEAVAAAAALNRLDAYPGDPTVALNFHFSIRAVAAIAPVDGQYMPGNRLLALQDVDYLTLQGSHDSDMTWFDGINPYERLKFTGSPHAPCPPSGCFKAAVYIDRANHGQFNTTWGQYDRSGFPNEGLLNSSQLMPDEEQRQIASVFLSAFLEATLHDRDEYRALFQDYRTGRDWLPEYIYISRYADGHAQTWANFEEDIDPLSGSLPGVSVRAENLAAWQERRVEMRTGRQDSSAVRLGWDRSKEEGLAQYRILLGTEALRPQPEAALIFSLASATASDPPQDFTLQLIDRQNRRAALPLSSFALLQPQISFHPHKLELFNSSDYTPSEAVFQSYIFPFERFLKVNADLNLAELAEIQLIFDLTEKGTIWLDDVGFR